MNLDAESLIAIEEIMDRKVGTLKEDLKETIDSSISPIDEKLNNHIKHDERWQGNILRCLGGFCCIMGTGVLTYAVEVFK